MGVRSFMVLPAAVLGAAVVLVSGEPAFAQSVNVTLNGNPVSLTPAPTQRAGRVFVPLRGIFERLGASVVYQGGVINAQGNNRSVSLKIGSTQATVNGQPQPLDVAPFIVGASTYVPLRFVSQALGATVNYDAANKIVAIANGGAAAPSATATAAQAAAKTTLRLSGVQPTWGGTVAARRPTIEAQFRGQTADPNSLRITLDSLDITNSASRSPTGFVYSPPSDLQSISHQVKVTGKDAQGIAFDEGWVFTSGSSTVQNELTNVKPVAGAQVGTQFTVSGQTLPGATVVVQVGAASNQTTVAGAVGSILGLGGGANVRNQVQANADGSFSTVVVINAAPGTNLQMVVNSTDPRTKAAAPAVSRTVTVH